MSIRTHHADFLADEIIGMLQHDSHCFTRVLGHTKEGYCKPSKCIARDALVRALLTSGSHSPYLSLMAPSATTLAHPGSPWGKFGRFIASMVD